MKCHYEVMELPRDASFEDIKKQYRKLALKWHPDRNHGQEELATQAFKEISTAYQVLSDPQERQWYDDHREAILRGKDGTAGDGDEDDEDFDMANQLNIWHYFNPTCFKQFDDAPDGFYTVYREIFDKITEKELDSFSGSQKIKIANQYPSFGSAESPAADVLQFYAAWENFVSSMTFAYADKYNVLEAPNRQVRRAMEKENSKYRDTAKKDYISLIKSLVAYTKKRDQRYITTMEERQKLKVEETKQKEEKKKQEKEKRKELMEQWKLEQEQDEENRQKERKGAFLLADNDTEEEEEEEDIDNDEEGGGVSSKSKGGSSKKKSKKNRKKNNMTRIRMVNDHRVDDDEGVTEEDNLYKQIKKLNLKSEVDTPKDGPEPIQEEFINNPQEIIQDPEAIQVEVNDLNETTEGVENEEFDEEEEEELEEVFSCEVCNKHFKSEPQLTQHISSKVHRKKVQDLEKSSKKKGNK
mmetsp:Transcript_19965/g.21696  ORF Transcript_19965/g.21696 Transcript_19965/m.21696 type:complete len:469 (+) Transcript_19965:32-1438(+)